MFAKGITSISLCPDLGKTPAIVNRKTGAMFINEKVWKKIPFNERMFIILHELGHIVLNTKNEFAADQFAFEQYAKLGLSLKDSVDAMAQVLSYANPQHYDRTIVQLQRALDYDHKVNHQPKIEIPMLKANELNPTNTHDAMMNGFYGGMHESFLGIGEGNGVLGKLVNNFTTNRQIKTQAKADKKTILANAKADKIRSQGLAAEILANQGVDQSNFGNTISSGLGDIGAGVAAALGGGSGKQSDMIGDLLGGLGGGKKNTGAKTPEEEKSSSTTWIIVVVVAVLAIGSAFIFFKGKGKK